MVAQLPPGPDFKQLFKRTNAAGQGDKGIAALGHQRFALVHGLHNVQFVTGMARVFFVDKRLGDHTHHAPARRLGRVRHDAHQATATAAIHQLTTACADPGPHGARGVGKQGVLAGARTAVHTQGKSGFSHEKTFDRARHPRCRNTTTNSVAPQRFPCLWRAWTVRAIRGLCGRWLLQCRY